jgi:hypothetical protein
MSAVLLVLEAPAWISLVADGELDKWLEAEGACELQLSLFDDELDPPITLSIMGRNLPLTKA